MLGNEQFVHGWLECKFMQTFWNTVYDSYNQLNHLYILIQQFDF